MGQRSLFVARYEATTHAEGKATHSHRRIAKHLHWNWGPHMILRAAQVVRHLRAVDDSGITFAYYAHEQAAALTTTFLVNQTTGVAMGFDSRHDESRANLDDHDNNNGAFLVDIDHEGCWTIGFLVGPEDGGDLATVASIDDYHEASRTQLALAYARKEDGHVFADAVEAALEIVRDAERDGHAMTQATANAMRRGASTSARQGVLI